MVLLAKHRTLPTVAAIYLAAVSFFALLKALPPEIAFHLNTPGACILLVLICVSTALLATLGWRAVLITAMLLLPLAIFLLVHTLLYSPPEIAERVELVDGSATLYSLLEHGMPDNAQVICIQNSLFSGCKVVDSWQSQQPCHGVLHVYREAYQNGTLSSIRDESSPASPLRRKCG